MPYKQLSIEEREFIQLAIWEKKSVRQVAKELNRNVSTISREISKNVSGRNIYYTKKFDTDFYKIIIKLYGSRFLKINRLFR